MGEQSVIARDDSRPMSRAIHWPAWLIATAPFAAFALALWAQAIVDRDANLPTAVAIYLLAAAVFVSAVHRQSPENAGEALSTVAVSPLRVSLLAAALGLTPVIFIESTGNQFRLLGVLSWLASILLFMFGIPHPALWQGFSQRLRAALSGRELTIKWEYVALVGITLLGAFYRFYKLDGILAEMGTDLPLKYGNIEQVLKGDNVIFFTSYPGREALFFYFASIPAKLFGLSHLTIKFSAAIVGTVTIPAIFFAGRRLFTAEAGLYAALLLAINHWHIILSRVGYRAILTPLFVVILAYLIARAADRRRDWDFAIVGLWIGLGMWTYNAWLVAPAAFLAALLAHAIARRNLPFVTIGRFTIISGAAGFLAWLPLGRFILEQPDTYFGRVATRVTSEERALPTDLIGVFLDNVKRTLAMFNYKGDSVFVENVPYLREMEFVTAVLFIFGVALIVWRWRHGYNALAMSLFFVMLLPSALSIAFPNEVPNSDRAAGGMGMAFLFAALPLPLLRQYLAKWLPAVRAGPVSMRLPVSSTQHLRAQARFALATGWFVPVVGLLVLSGDAVSSFNSYFVEYAAAQPYHNYPLSLELARTIDDFYNNGPVYIKYLPYWYDGNALRTQLQRAPHTWDNESDHFDASAPPFQDFAGKFMFILHPDDKDGLSFLQETFPSGISVDHYDSLGTVEFVTFVGAK